MFKIRNAIREAAVFSDPPEAIAHIEQAINRRELHAFLNTGASLKIRRQLANIYMRATRSVDALDAMRLGRALESLPSVDALIVDPGFRHLSGHSQNANFFYRRACERAGLTTAIARPADGRGSFVDETMSTVALAVSPADLDVEQGSESDLDTANRIFAAEFAQALPRKLPRLLIVHTVHPMFLDGLVDYLVTAERGGQSSLLLGFVAMPFTTESTDTIRQSLARLSHVALRILLVGETEAAADQLRGIAPPSLSVTSSPFVGVYLTQPRRNVRSDEAVTAGFVGQMRKERGANLIPEIAALTTTANPGRLKWRVQFDRGQAGERFDDQAASQLDALSGAGKLNIIEGGLTTRDYQALLGSIDIMVMPYSQSYSVSPSGVAVESLMSGCVLVAPAESTMAAMAERFDAGIVTFRHQTAATISDAVNEAVDRFDNLAAKASTAAARMADAKTSAPILRFIASA